MSATLETAERDAGRSPWSVVAARVTGPHHLTTGMPCQDACQALAIKGGRLIAVLSDGAGSARHAHLGSAIATRAVSASLVRAVSTVPDLPADPRAAIEEAIETARGEIEREIAGMADAATMRDFHATLVGCIADPQRGVFFHVGDGAGCALPDLPNVAGPDWDGATVSEAANGEHANETYFLTNDDWRQQLRLTDFVGAKTIVLMSDGVTPFAMSRNGACPEPRFLGPVHAFLAAAQDPGLASQALQTTLDDERARKISGDDKSLIWARWIG